MIVYKKFPLLRSPEGAEGGTPTPEPGPTITPQPEPEPKAGEGTEGSAEASVAGAAGGEAPPKPTKDWRDARIGELQALRRQEERKRVELQAQLDRLRQAQPQATPPSGATQISQAPQAVPEEEIQRRAAEIARNMEFNRQCNRIAAQGKSEFQDFDARLENFKQIDGMPPAVIEAALELEEDGLASAHTIIYNLASNLDEAMRIKSLSPSRLGAALVKLAKAPQARQVSGAPEPPGRMARGPATQVAKDPDQMPYKDWLEWREKTARQGRR